MNKLPLITIVTVSYNAVNCIEKTILSVLEQKYTNIEYIIIDGGSTDGTIDILKKYEHKITTWISEPDKGIYDAMNKGIKLATGQWINFMNCGDSFVDEHVLSKLSEYFVKENEIIYGNMYKKIGKDLYDVKAYNLDILNNHMPFCHQSTFVQTILTKNNPFDTKYKFVADYNMFYNLYKKGHNFLYIDLPISIYQIEEGYTASNISACYLETYMINGKKPGFLTHTHLKIREILLKYLPKNFVRGIRRILYHRNKLNSDQIV